MREKVGRHAHIWQNPFKIFFFRNTTHMTLNPGVKHCDLRLSVDPIYFVVPRAIRVSSNYDPRLTSTYFIEWSNSSGSYVFLKIKSHIIFSNIFSKPAWPIKTKCGATMSRRKENAFRIVFDLYDKYGCHLHIR